MSNRGPVEFKLDDDGKVTAVPGQGGLATALTAAARLQPTMWLSSPMTDLDRSIMETHVSVPGIEADSRFVATDPQAYELFYGCFSNEVLWFLQHSMPLPEELDAARIEQAWHDGYLPVNEAFAEVISAELKSQPFRAVMFHDYHFYAAPALVKAANPNVYLQHFIHIPWPSPVEWERLAPRFLKAILEGILGNDSIVFQTPESARNFLLTLKAFLPKTAVDLENSSVVVDSRKVRVWANAISVDPQELSTVASTPEFSRHRWLLRSSRGQKTIVRVDRLDPSKNVGSGFEAYRMLLRDHPELHKKVSFLALFIPSRSDIAFYKAYQDEVFSLAKSINREFGSFHWKPVRLYFEHNRIQALAAMSLYDVLLVNSLADGMNLVAKEGPMLNLHDGALVLSKRVGAYVELGDYALGVDPEDVDATAAALYTALTMPPTERRERAVRLKQSIREHDLEAWFTALLRDIEEHTQVAASSVA